MKISQATAKPTDLDVPFDGDVVLKVKYRPLTYTVREMESLQEDERNVARIIETIQRLVVEWDLEDDEGNIVGLDDESLRDIPTHIFLQIIREVSNHQSVGAEGKASAAGS